MEWIFGLLVYWICLWLFTVVFTQPKPAQWRDWPAFLFALFLGWPYLWWRALRGVDAGKKREQSPPHT